MFAIIAPGFAWVLMGACTLLTWGLPVSHEAPVQGDEPQQARNEPPASQADPPPEATPPEEPEPTPDEPEKPATAPVSAEEVLEAFQRDRPTRMPIKPVGATDEIDQLPEPGTEPGLESGSYRLPDGSWLADRAGRVTRDGAWYVFVFEGYNNSFPEPPMKLLPNQLLERMVLEAEGTDAGTVFIVSGEVTEFQYENYLLLRKLLRRRNLGNLRK
jgi:hypothetical protein